MDRYLLIVCQGLILKNRLFQSEVLSDEMAAPNGPHVWHGLKIMGKSHMSVI